MTAASQHALDPFARPTGQPLASQQRFRGQGPMAMPPQAVSPSFAQPQRQPPFAQATVVPPAGGRQTHEPDPALVEWLAQAPPAPPMSDFGETGHNDMFAPDPAFIQTFTTQPLSALNLADAFAPPVVRGALAVPPRAESPVRGVEWYANEARRLASRAGSASASESAAFRPATILDTVTRKRKHPGASGTRTNTAKRAKPWRDADAQKAMLQRAMASEPLHAPDGTRRFSAIGYACRLKEIEPLLDDESLQEGSKAGLHNIRAHHKIRPITLDPEQQELYEAAIAALPRDAVDESGAPRFPNGTVYYHALHERQRLLGAEALAKGGEVTVRQVKLDPRVFPPSFGPQQQALLDLAKQKVSRFDAKGNEIAGIDYAVALKEAQPDLAYEPLAAESWVPIKRLKEHPRINPRSLDPEQQAMLDEALAQRPRDDYSSATAHAKALWLYRPDLEVESLGVGAGQAAWRLKDTMIRQNWAAELPRAAPAAGVSAPPAAPILPRPAAPPADPGSAPSSP